MLKRSLLSLPSVMLLSSLLSLLGACSHLPSRPGPAPVVLKCQPPEISPELMTPPQVQAINRLLTSLGMSPIRLLSAKQQSSISTDSKSSSLHN